MTIFALPQGPSTLSMALVGNTALFASPLIASAQTIDRGGLKWRATYNYTNISHTKRRELMGLMASLKAQGNRLRVPVHDNPRDGLYGGTPLVDGASQTGTSLAIKGCSTGITNWIRAGDYFSVDVNGDHELKMCVADANSDGSGDIAALTFEPPLRTSPLNNAAIFVEDGVLSKPEGIFVLADSTIGWSSRPFQSGSELSQLVLSMIEDVFATQ